MEHNLVTDAIFADLEGSWTLERQIKGVGSMHGKVTFRRINHEVLEYYEEGLFKLVSGIEFNAFRTLFYCREEERIAIRFRQGSAKEDLLFRLQLEADTRLPWPSAARSEHLCGKDIYSGSYTFEAPGKMRMSIDIRGPNKYACIETALSKAQ